MIKKEQVIGKIKEYCTALDNLQLIMGEDQFINKRIGIKRKTIEETKYIVEHITEFSGTDENEYLEFVFMICHNSQRRINNFILETMID